MTQQLGCGWLDPATGRGVAALALLGGLTGCVSTAPVHGAMPQAPLLQQREARIEVFYPEAVRAAEFSNPVTRVPLGMASVTRLDQAFAALFTSVSRAPDSPSWRSQLPLVDGVIEVDDAGMEVTLGNDAKMLGTAVSRPDRVSVRYHACLYRPSGVRIQCWEALVESVHQRGIGESFTDSVTTLADRAMSDAVAQLSRAIENDAAVRTWPLSLRGGVVSEPTAAPAVTEFRIGVVWWPVASEAYDQAEDIERCLSSTISEHAPLEGIVPQKKIRRALYPLLEPTTQPASEESLAQLLSRADVQTRLGGLGLSHLVAFAGGRIVQPAEGFGFCVPYYGCFGYAWRSEDSRLDAALWNLRAEQGSQALAAEAGGTTMIPAFGVPIPLPARTLSEACEQLGGRIADVLKSQAAEAPDASATRAAPVPGPPPTPPGARE